MNERKRLAFRLLVLPFLAAILLPYSMKRWMFDHNFSIFYFLLVSSGISFGLIPVMYKLGMAMDITDHPGGRHTHKHITPRTGGIAIFITFIITLNLVIDPPREFQGLFWASCIMAFIGIVDDIKSLPATVKMLGQIIAVTVLIWYGFTFSFLPDTFIGNTVEILLTYLWILGIVNAFNCLDGMDGLAAGVGIIILGFFSWIAYSVGDMFLMVVSIILLGAILGFLPYNFRVRNKGLIFLGDTGSTFIGFTIAALSIYGNWGQDKSVDMIIPVLLLAVPITDMVMTTVIRTTRKQVRSLRELMAYAGNDHFHHRLQQLGIQPKQTVIVIYLLTIVMGLISLLLKHGDFASSLISLAIGIIIFYMIVAFMLHADKEKKQVEKK
ncbi:MAG: MraY family glycosyltransferase [Candidatus Marinimicrobia bacterium]|nr:MraY family glycosyltransferase [Candidatus Neomarinimicrobiota bacterium]